MSETIPIFPLDNVVLLPQVEVPLYIFEPRYRRMTEAALSGSRRIGMVVVRPEHAEGFATAATPDMSGDPRVFEVGCAGDIRSAEKAADGTYNIVLRGAHRFRIVTEVPRGDDRLYRVADVDVIEDLHPREDFERVADLRQAVLELMRGLVPDRAERFSRELFSEVDDGTFVNAFCQAIDFPTVEKQQLMEANGVRERAEQLVTLMRFRIAEQSTADPSKARSLH
jgi:Lon protease-like protein